MASLNLIFQILLIVGTLISVSQQRPRTQYNTGSMAAYPMGSPYDTNMIPATGTWNMGALPQMAPSYPLSLGTGSYPLSYGSPITSGMSTYPAMNTYPGMGTYLGMGTYPGAMSIYPGMGSYPATNSYYPIPLGGTGCATGNLNPCALKDRRIYRSIHN